MAFSWLPRNHHHLLESSWAWPGADTYHRCQCCTHDGDSQGARGAMTHKQRISNHMELWFPSSPTMQPRFQLRLPAICHLVHNSQVMHVFRYGKWSVIPSIKNKDTPRFYLFGFFLFFFIALPCHNCQTAKGISRDRQSHMPNFYWAWKIYLLVCL